MIPVYISNGCIVTRYNGRDFHLIPKYARQLPVDGVEFLMYYVWDDEVKELRRFLRSSGISFPVTHMDKQVGELLAESGLEYKEEILRWFRRDLATACELGSKKLVLHLWNGPYSDRNFDCALDLYGELYELADKEGILLTAENVACKTNLCLTHLKALLDKYPFARFTYDTKMAFLHKENEMLGNPEWESIIPAVSHLHMNDSQMADIGGGRLPIMHIGDGDVDFKSFFALMKERRFSGTATIESTSVLEDGSVQIEKLKKSIETVRKGLNG